MSRLTKAWRNSRFYRRLVAKRLPRALVIGAQKAGTTALFKYLAQHPRLAPSLEKEVDFFGSDSRFAQGLHWYAAQWDRQTPAKTLRIEASPHYLFAPQAPARIRRCLPNVKLIAIVRGPVERAYSAWHMYRRQLCDDPAFYDTWNRRCYRAEEIAAFVPRTAYELDDFELAVRREAACLADGRAMSWRLLEYGLYGPQLRRYLDHFPRQQLLMLDSRDLKLERAKTLNRVLAFLGLEPWDWSQADLSDVWVSQPPPPMPPRARDFLREFYTPSNRWLQELLDPLPAWARASPHDSAAA